MVELSLTRGDVVVRARAAADIPHVKYRLGGGKQHPRGADPLDEQRSADCSAFAMWCLGEPKLQKFAWLVKFNGGWFNTDGICYDALAESTGIFSRVLDPEPGDLVVYPSSHSVGGWMRKFLAQDVKPAKLPKIGHVGVISEVVWEPGDAAHKASRVVHCSHGNETQRGTAIHETNADLWLRHPGSVYVRCVTLRE